MNLKREIPLIAIVLLPIIYLGYVWNELPNTVAMHWNINGEVDRYGSKTELIYLSILLPALIYGIFLVVPKIDPKKNLNKMGNKLQVIKFVSTIFMSILAIIIIYIAKHESSANPNYLVLVIGVLFVFLGNYLKTIKANYFIGIRTPWTLENETVWKETHKVAGIMWFIGGLTIILSSLVLANKPNFRLFLVITLIITIVPILFSYFKFQDIQKQTS